MTLNKEQQKIFDKITKIINGYYEEGAFETEYFMITGKAGTGKSFLSAQLIHYFAKTLKFKPQCTAMTHKALKELKSKLINIKILNGVSTVHSYFNITPKITKDGKEVYEVNKHAKKSKKCSVLFIDEVSMLSKELFQIIEKNSYLYDIIILVGDEFQLPPVNDDFNIFKNPNIKIFKLKNIVRQEVDNPIINLASDIVKKIESKDFQDPFFCLNKIKEYQCSNIILQNSQKEFIESYYCNTKESVSKPILESKFYKSLIVSYTNEKVNFYNLIAKCIYRNTRNINYIDNGDLLILQEPVFDEYLDIIKFNNNDEFLVKDLSKSIYKNVDVYIASQDNDSIRIVRPEGRNMYNFLLNNLASQAKSNPKLWKSFYDFKKGFTEVKQFFACTIHKSQGSTVEDIYVDLKGMPWYQDPELSFRLLYVALTRASQRAYFF